MSRRPPTLTRTYTLLPCTTLFRPGPGADLHHTADIARRDHLRRSRLEVPYLARLQLGRDRRLQQVVGARRATAEMRLRRLDDREARLAERSEEHTSELQSLMRISYAVFCLKKKKHKQKTDRT